MTDQTDNKAAFDAAFPPLPATRRSSQMVNDMLTVTDARNAKKDDVAATVSGINTAITALQTAVTGIGASKADASTVSSLSSTLTALQATVAALPAIPAANIAWVPAVSARALVSNQTANGVRPSTTYNTLGIYNVKLITTASIAGNADGYVVGEICATNSATGSDWIEVSRAPNAQALTLAITLQSIQTSGSPLIVPVPKGWYMRIRQVTTTGTVSFAITSQTETPMS